MNLNGNDRGVQRTGPEAKSAPPKTVQGMVKMEMYFVEIGDEAGRRVRVLAFKVGNQWFHDPQAEASGWFDRLRQIDKNTWLFKALDGKAAPEEPGAVPTTDTVDIVPTPVG